MVIEKSVIDEIPEEAYNVLDEFGVPSHMAGYDYIAYASLLLMNDPNRELRVVYDIYTAVAKVFGKSRYSVERSVRQAVVHVFDNTDPSITEKYFGNSISIGTGRVTSSQFLYTVSRIVRRKLVNK